MFLWAKRSTLGETVAIHRLGRARRQRQRSGTRPDLETLEGRELLSAYTGPSAVRNILSSGGVFRIQVEGPGLIKVHPAGKGAIDLSAFGTNAGYHPQCQPGAPALPLPQSASFDPQADCHVWSARWTRCLRSSTDGDHDSAHEHDGKAFTLGELGPARRCRLTEASA